MRIAVNVEQLLQASPGGIGRYTARLVSLLARLYPDDDVVGFCARHARVDITAALGAAGAAELAEPGRVAAFGLPRPVLYDAWHALGVPPLRAGGAALRGIDVVHAPSLAVPPPGPARLVVSVHDVGPVLFADAFTRHGRFFHRQGLRAAERRADAIVTVSRAAAAEIAEHTRIRPDRIRVVPNGVDRVDVSDQRLADCLERFALGADGYVFWVGSREPRKGLDTLLAAMARLRRRRNGLPVRLVLAGYQGWRNAGLVADEDRTALGADLVELGQVDDADLWCLYRGARLFAFPSRHEGFGLPVLEAMTQGAAVVCSDLPALREVAGDAARFVPAGDADAWAGAIGELLDDAQARAALGASGRSRSADFSWETTVRSLHDIYEELG